MWRKTLITSLWYYNSEYFANAASTELWIRVTCVAREKTSIICYVFVKLETLKAMLLRSYSKKVGLPNKSPACVCKLCITDPCLWTFPWIIHSCFLQNTPFYIPLNLKAVFLSPSLLSRDCSLFFIFPFRGCAGLCVTDIPRYKVPIAEQDRNAYILLNIHPVLLPKLDLPSTYAVRFQFLVNYFFFNSVIFA